jgi:hypothetical protein
MSEEELFFKVFTNNQIDEIEKLGYYDGSAEVARSGFIHASPSFDTALKIASTKFPEMEVHILQVDCHKLMESGIVVKKEKLKTPKGNWMDNEHFIHIFTDKINEDTLLHKATINGIKNKKIFS